MIHQSSATWRVSLVTLSCLISQMVAAQFSKLESRSLDSLTQGLPFAAGVNPLPPELRYVSPGGKLGHWGVGNGGDYLRIGFARAREHAANIVGRMSPESLATIQNEETRQWLLTHKDLLAADILTSTHVWESDEKPSCGWTVGPGPADPIPTAQPIQLSYPTCRDQVFSFYRATQLLIHESVHHFGEGEDLADRVAIAVVNAWREGRIEWLPLSTVGAPSPRSRHSAVWTGSHMVVFGGIDSQGNSLGDGYRYSPKEDLWEAIPELEGLAPRYFHAAHWTGSEMIVWGGYKRSQRTSLWQYDGFIWNPQTATVTPIKAPLSWKPLSNTWTFDPRQMTVWTGEQLLVWGGLGNDGKPLGGSYDPAGKSWKDLGRNLPEAPAKIAGHSLAFTGESLIVWGGYEGQGSGRTISRGGAIWDFASQTWRATSQVAAPSPRAGHAAVWTGDKLMVFSGGGVSSQRELKGTGGIYDPATDTWEKLTTEMVIERIGHSATWNGHEVLVYGGRSNRLRTFFGEVYNFDPASGRWSGVNSQYTPASRYYHTAIWTGSSLIIWGGTQGLGKDFNDGALYFP